MRLVLGLVEVKESQCQRTRCKSVLRGPPIERGRQSMGGGQTQAAGILSKENRDTGNQQRAGQPLHDGGQQGLNVCL